MIYEKDLDESIARYLGEPDPTINTCIKLASCYTVRRELFGDSEPAYSFAASPAPVDTRITYTSDTDFSRAIDGMEQDEVWPVMDELMDAVHVLMPRLYDSVMRKLQ